MRIKNKIGGLVGLADKDKISMADHMAIVKRIMQKKDGYANGGEVAEEMEVRPDKGYGKVIRVGMAHGGEIMDEDESSKEHMSEVDSAHMDDDLASPDDRMNENMGSPDEDPKMRRRKMIMSMIGR